ncbi:MAG: HEAT repeat domain-containing protein [Candidatus Omnitrophica bacterium]|nr:HEAT repeat domain-containing protein [Candidatus Omnitrophota bacterium]
MEQQLQELKLKQQKLIFLFGEAVYQLCRSRDVRLLYTSKGKEKEQSVEKLEKLLDYTGDRIAKIEEICAEDEDIIEEAEAEEEGAVVAEEEEDVADPEEAEEEVVVGEAVPAEKEFPAEEFSPVAEIEVPEEELSLPVQESVLTVVQETETIEDEVREAVEEEQLVSEPLAREESGPDDILARFLKTAQFSSDAEKRLFEKNISQLARGSEREREVSIGQIAHTTSKDVLRQVYEFALKDESVPVRLAVVKSMSRVKEGESEGFFELALNDSDIKVRTAAIKGLGGHVSDPHRRILEGLLKDGDSHIRGLAATYLGIYYGKDGVRKAISVATDESPYVRTSLLEMLSIVQPEGALTVVKDLLSDKEEAVRKAAEKALEKLMPERKRSKSNGKRKK